MFGLDDAVGPDDDTAPLRRIATQSEQAVVAIDALGSAYGAALVVANRFAIVAGKELNNAAAAQQKMLDATLNATKETKDAIKEESQDVVDQFQQLESLGTSAFSGLTSSISQLSLAAFFRKDGKALKEFGKSLGQMLVQLGTMAVVYAGVAALSAVFPALAPLVGPAAAAPALFAAGTAAIAAGAALGSATGGKGPRRGKEDGANPSDGGAAPSRTNIYNVQFDSFSPPRSRSRAVLESVGEAIEGGA